jgi:hypothetical protein
VSEVAGAGHLDAMDIAAFANNTLDAPTRGRVVEHLNVCRECRNEVMDASRIASTLAARGRWWTPVTGFAIAAALLLVVLLPKAGRRAPSEPLNRAPSPAVPVLRGGTAAGDTAGAPTPVTPREVVDRADRLVWSAVAGALRYRVRLYDDNSNVLWSSTTEDTVALLPDSVRLRPRLTYFWKVEANMDWQRWISSDLVAFTVSGPRR